MSEADIVDPPGHARGLAARPDVEPPDAEPSVAVVVATRGRPAVLAEVLGLIAAQRRRPDAILVSCATPDDAGPVLGDPAVEVVLGPPGLARQRNAALDRLAGRADIVAFFDDDFVPRADWLGEVLGVFRRLPGVAAVTGTVAEDGIKGPGLTVAHALAVLAATATGAPARLREGAIPYGCNMAFRAAAVADLRFDPRLIRYGWLEDRDFGAALLNRGWRSVQLSSAVGVHLGVKGGRVPGRMLGYSQVVNPLYLRRKGTMATAEVARHVGRNLAANFARALVPEPWIDRRGRLLGNLAGLADVARGRLDPERAERL